MTRRAMCVAAVLAAAASAVAAQPSKTIPGETISATVTIEAIDHSRREVSVKKADGTYEVLYIPPSFTRFDTLKVGDTVAARYYETMVLRLKAPGEKDVDELTENVTKAPGGAPGVTSAAQRTITATIAAIDPKTPSVTFTGPNGWRYTSKVKDKNALAKVKVGDKLDITWTYALLLSLGQSK